MQPTNITLLASKDINPVLIKEVKTADTFEGMSNNLNSEGLYSVEIFGKVGRQERSTKEGYINLGLAILNPTYYQTVVKLSSLYKGILNGTLYATWDSTEKDFIKSNILDGETGYSFFMKHFNALAPKLNRSYVRKQRIEVFNKFKNIAKINKFIVIPAGIRDIEFNPTGGIKEQEINELYRKLIFKTRALERVSETENDNPIYDNVRSNIQSNVQEIDKHLFDILDGKSGALQSKVGTRGLVSSTRNVIVARRVTRDNLWEESGKNVNSTDVGLFQSLMMFPYNCTHALMSGYLNDVFIGNTGEARLVEPKTLESTFTMVPSKDLDKWNTPEGINKLFNGFKQTHIRHKPIKINGNYLGLIYDDGKEVKIFNDITDLPEGKDKKHVRPLTYIELFYLECCRTIEDNLVQQTRYPVIGTGSIYPARTNLITSSEGSKRVVLNEYWEEEFKVTSFPDFRKDGRYSYYDAMSVDICRYSALDGDNDGDKVNK